MKLYGRSSLSEFLEDRVVYRSLVPQDPRLPALSDLGPALGLAPGRVPRKTERDYARVMARILRAAQARHAPRQPIRRLVLVGDTRLNDGTAFSNLCQAGDWQGWAFIGSETSADPQVEILPNLPGGPIYAANRWSALEAFDRHLAGEGFPMDQATAVVVDIDKTALGARGRNAAAIDAARVQAVRETVAESLGAGFDSHAFQAAYEQLNQTEYHPFTADNQDYLAYICLILGSGIISLQALLADLESGRLAAFEQFLDQVESRTGELPSGLAALHREIANRVRAGDPTPYKVFRRTEYRTTVARMGHLPDEAPMNQRLADEIVLTQEVRAWALAWQARGALLFGLSDKPDEASVPPPEAMAQGAQPIHRVETHVVGSSLEDRRLPTASGG